MQLNITSLLAALALALATTAAADSMTVSEYWNAGISSRSGKFTTDFGTYDVNANDGCRTTKVPGMGELCVDVGSARGHFRYGGQNKRCMKRTSRQSEGCTINQCFQRKVVRG